MLWRIPCGWSCTWLTRAHCTLATICNSSDILLRTRFTFLYIREPQPSALFAIIRHYALGMNQAPKES